MYRGGFPRGHARIHTYHHPRKANIVGNGIHHVPPAWRTAPPANAPTGPRPGPSAGMEVEAGSKILISKLPEDVQDREIEELFRKTVGPLCACYVVCDAQGRSRGMAVVEFVRVGDAVLARKKYNGKIIDGRKPIRIEVVLDGEPATTGAAAATGVAAGTMNATTPSLFQRLDMPKTKPVVNGSASLVNRVQPLNNIQGPTKVRRKARKGPKRLKKMAERQEAAAQSIRGSMSKEQLDAEMDLYNSSSP